MEKEEKVKEPLIREIDRITDKLALMLRNERLTPEQKDRIDHAQQILLDLLG